MIEYTEREIGPFHCIQFEEAIESQHIESIDELFQSVLGRGLRRIILAFQHAKSVDVGFSLPLVRLKNFLNENEGKLILFETPIEFEFILRVGRLCDNVDFKVLDENATELSAKK